jgi:mannose/fructose/N-acetylgalactosamine-specific phosphotransferase system component IIB
VPIELHRVDDRLIHGQVVVGWGQPLDLRRIVMVDDEVATSEWEQELYRMGVPTEMQVDFLTVSDAIAAYTTIAADPRPTMILVGDIDTMIALCAGVPAITAINLGGLHHKPGRHQRLQRRLFRVREEHVSQALATRNVDITAQDLPAARKWSLDATLSGEHTA